MREVLFDSVCRLNLMQQFLVQHADENTFLPVELVCMEVLSCFRRGQDLHCVLPHVVLFQAAAHSAFLLLASTLVKAFCHGCKIIKHPVCLILPV